MADLYSNVVDLSTVPGAVNSSMTGATINGDVSRFLFVRYFDNSVRIVGNFTVNPTINGGDTLFTLNDDQLIGSDNYFTQGVSLFEQTATPIVDTRNAHFLNTAAKAILFSDVTTADTLIPGSTYFIQAFLMPVDYKAQTIHIWGN